MEPGDGEANALPWLFSDISMMQHAHGKASASHIQPLYFCLTLARFLQVGIALVVWRDGVMQLRMP